MWNRRAIGPVLAAVVMLPALLAGLRSRPNHAPEYTDAFMLEECGGFSTIGRNPYFVLEPGYRLSYEGEEDGETVRLTITVLHKTQVIDGVETRVVKEREVQGGELVEISWNYFALCNRTNAVVYFGEDVNMYEDGVVVDHEGAWRAGENGARAGIIMPGHALIGARYYQEIAPGVALDRAENVSINEVVRTPAGTFENCLQVRETTPLEPGNVGIKWYAPGIGLVQDGPLSLVGISTAVIEESEE